MGLVVRFWQHSTSTGTDPMPNFVLDNMALHIAAVWATTSAKLPYSKDSILRRVCHLCFEKHDLRPICHQRYSRWICLVSSRSWWSGIKDSFRSLFVIRDKIIIRDPQEWSTSISRWKDRVMRSPRRIPKKEGSPPTCSCIISGEP